MAERTRAQLLEMSPHVHYEADKMIAFVMVGNTWLIEFGPDERQDRQSIVRAHLAAESMLEAALIHVRCVAEFLRTTRHKQLSDGTDDDLVIARDYLPDWHWKEGKALKSELTEVHGRVAHLGLIRLSVQRTREGYSWREFLTGPAVVALLGGMRLFLSTLKKHDPEMAKLVNQPTPQSTSLELAIHALLPTAEAG